MDNNNKVRLTESEKLHQKVMRAVVDKVQDTPYILKGGTALLLTRGLPRHSTDLDFDSGKKLNLQNRICDGLKEAGVELGQLNLVKDTQTVQRFKVHYLNPATQEDELLKIETSFRKEPEKSDIEKVDGINTYTIDKIYDQKLDALEGRTSPRDLFDIAHLTKVHGNKLSEEQINRTEAITQDMEKLAARYYTAVKDDVTLGELTTADDLVLDIREAIEHQKNLRSLHRSPEEQVKREVIEAVIERDLTKQYPNDPENVKIVMDIARKALDKKEADGYRYPDIKVREAAERSIEQTPSKEPPLNKNDDIER